MSLKKGLKVAMQNRLRTSKMAEDNAFYGNIYEALAHMV